MSERYGMSERTKKMSTKKRGGKELPYDRQAVFCRQMAFVVKAGIPLSNAFEFLTTDIEDSESLAIMEQVFTVINGGSTFSDALRETGYFSEYLISVVELGEKTGSLEQALFELADYFEQLYSIRRKVNEAFTYPLILFVMMAAVILFLIIVVLPQFAQIISGAGGQLPAVAAGIMNFGIFVRDHAVVIIAAIILIVAAIWVYLRSTPGKAFIDRLSMRGSFGRVTKLLTTARFCSAMKMALSCGNSFADSVKLTSSIIFNTEVKKRLRTLQADAESGLDIPQAVAKADIFPKSFVSLFATAYRTGNLEQTFARMAGYYQEGYDDALYSMTSKIEPALVITLSIIAGVILFSVMLPIIDIMQLIS